MASPATTIYVVTLPSGRVVEFREITGFDRRKLLEAIVQRSGRDLSAERLNGEFQVALPQWAIESDSGGSVDPQFWARYDKWNQADIHTYQIAFYTSMGITEELTAQYAEIGKSLRQN